MHTNSEGYAWGTSPADHAGRARTQMTQTDRERDAAPHVSHYGCAGLAAAVGEQISEDQRAEACNAREAEDKASGFSQCRPEPPCNFEDRYKSDESNGKMNCKWMKSPEKLLPIGMSVAVELDDFRKQQQRNAHEQGDEPGRSCKTALWKELVAACGQDFRDHHARNPGTMFAGVGPVSFCSRPWNCR